MPLPLWLSPSFTTYDLRSWEEGLENPNEIPVSVLKAKINEIPFDDIRFHKGKFIAYLRDTEYNLHLLSETIIQNRIKAYKQTINIIRERRPDYPSWVYYLIYPDLYREDETYYFSISGPSLNSRENFVPVGIQNTIFLGKSFQLM